MISIKIFDYEVPRNRSDERLERRNYGCHYNDENVDISYKMQSNTKKVSIF